MALVLFAFGMTVLIPIIPLFVTEELDAPAHWIGTATLCVAIMAVATRIPGGALSDRRGRRVIMVIGAVVGIAASILYMLSDSVVVFLVGRLMTGASLGLFSTVGKAVIADVAPPVRRGEAMGMSNAAFSVATVLSPLLSEGLKNTAGFNAVFILSGVLSLLALGAALLLPGGAPERPTAPSARRDVGDAMRERGSWAALMLIISMGAVLTTLFTFYPLLAERKDLFTDAPRVLAYVAMGLGLSIYALTDTIVEPAAGWLSDRVGRQPVVLPGLVITVIGTVLLSKAVNTLTAYAAIAVMTVGFGAVRAVADSIAQDAVPPALRGMGAAILYTGFDLAIGIDAQVLSGLIKGDNFSAYFSAVVGLIIVFGGVGLLLSLRLVAYENRPDVASLRPPAVGD